MASGASSSRPMAQASRPPSWNRVSPPLPPPHPPDNASSSAPTRPGRRAGHDERCTVSAARVVRTARRRPGRLATPRAGRRARARRSARPARRRRRPATTAVRSRRCGGARWSRDAARRRARRRGRATAPTTAPTTPTAAPLATMTSRMLRSVAPSAASMPSARSRRWASTVKPAAATSPMKISPTTAIAKHDHGGRDRRWTGGGVTGRTPWREREHRDGSPAWHRTAPSPGSGAASWPGCTSAKSSSRFCGFSTRPTTRRCCPRAARPSPTRRSSRRELTRSSRPARRRRVAPGDQGEHRPAVRPVRVLRAQLDALDQAGRRCSGSRSRRPCRTAPDGGDVGGEVRIGAGQGRPGGRQCRTRRRPAVGCSWRPRRPESSPPPRRRPAPGPGSAGATRGGTAATPSGSSPAGRAMPPSPRARRPPGARSTAPVIASLGCSASSDSGPAGGSVWSTTRPSRRNITRSAHEASCASWVTTTAATPRRQAASIRRITASPLAESSAPDGSSASSSCRSPTTARAIATRCRSPPDSWSGKCGARSARPSSSSAGQAAAVRALRAGHAVQLQRQRDVLRRGQPGEQVVVLEHVADRAAAQPGLGVARHARQRVAADEHLAAGRVLQAAGDGQQRALARPARAHHRHHRARLDDEVDAAQRVHLGRRPRRRSW